MDRDPRTEFSYMRISAGFLNTLGSTLAIGVSDSGDPVGIGVDGFPNEDKMLLDLDILVKTRLGPQCAMYIHPRFEDYKGTRVVAVDCLPASSAVYLKEGEIDRFFIRAGASTLNST
jgi:predicted HTH transcriptional regulator